MNYYQRHIGDYARDTGHLSLLEHGVYMVLLDYHYASEAGIPEGKQYRLARARTRKEREAVDNVLDEFFDLSDGIWINRRAHHETLRYHAGLSDADAHKRGVADRQAKARERRKALFEALGRHGVIPAFNASMQELRKILATVTSRPVIRDVTRDVTAKNSDVTCDVTAIHKPLPNNQQPSTNIQKPEDLSVGDVTQDLKTGIAGEVFSARAECPPIADLQERVIEACKALRQLGVTDVHPDLPKLRRAIEAGATTGHLRAIAEKHLSTGKRLNGNYIAGTAIGQLHDARDQPATSVANVTSRRPRNPQEVMEQSNHCVAHEWLDQGKDRPEAAYEAD